MPASSSTAPSVLLIIADDWSPIAGCYGNRVIQTPHIDALARRGVVFDHAFCTTPSCAASRANLLTGLYAHTHGQYGHSHDIHGFRTHEWVTSLPAVLRQAGVRSGLIGKQHIAPLAVYPFDVFAAADATMSIRRLTDAVEGFLEETGDQPFYLQVAPTYPHRVGYAYGADLHHDEFPAFNYHPGDVDVPDWLPDLPEVRQDLAHYYEAISRWDHCVGRVLGALEGSGRADDTLVVVMSDHGMPFPGAKASSFEAGHHCPLIVAPPGAVERTPMRSQALVNWTDLMPTVLDHLDVDRNLWPRRLAGRSFLSVLDESEPGGWHETYYAHCFHEVTNYFPYRVLRGRRYKFVQHLASDAPMPLPADLFRSPTWTAVREQEVAILGRRSYDVTLHRPAEALYDLQADPLETHNHLDDPALRHVADAMRGKLMDLRIHTADPWLEDDFHRGRVTQEQLSRARAAVRG